MGKRGKKWLQLEEDLDGEPVHAAQGKARKESEKPKKSSKRKLVVRDDRITDGPVETFANDPDEFVRDDEFTISSDSEDQRCPDEEKVNADEDEESEDEPFIRSVRNPVTGYKRLLPIDIATKVENVYKFTQDIADEKYEDENELEMMSFSLVILQNDLAAKHGFIYSKFLKGVADGLTDPVRRYAFLIVMSMFFLRRMNLIASSMLSFSHRSHLDQ